MSCVRLSAVLLAAAALGFAPAPFLVKPPWKPPARPLEALMGDWQDPSQPLTVVSITPKEFTYRRADGQNIVYNLTLDVSHSPFKYDIRLGVAHIVGIWKIEGDKLTLHYLSEQRGLPDGGRPKSFVSPITEVYVRKGAKK